VIRIIEKSPKNKGEPVSGCCVSFLAVSWCVGEIVGVVFGVLTVRSRSQRVALGPQDAIERRFWHASRATQAAQEIGPEDWGKIRKRAARRLWAPG
jgi:hypothetical protein